MNAPEAHLVKVCAGMAAFVPRHEPFPQTFKRSADPYQALVRAVVFQQLSGKAAQTILNRVVALFDPPFPEPEDLAKVKEPKLRAAGLSRQKIAALKDIAAKRLDGTIPTARTLAKLDDEAIVERLTAARGVGRWTVQMYLIFSLGRPDILPLDDLGVRKGAGKMLGRELTVKELAAYGERWGPHRSAAAWHCWRAVDTVTLDAT
jgi:DNA-3-methyladenine glycosylase II